VWLTDFAGIDDVVIFDSLTRDNLRQILRLLISDLAKRLEQVELRLTDRAADFMLEEAYDEAYGARPLRRYIEKYVGTALSRLFIAGEIDKNVASIVEVDAIDRKLVLNVQKKRRLTADMAAAADAMTE
jgi:ATP-dependent Clp protease ATP-binding subunit ClpB